jgi:hypothetical protein
MVERMDFLSAILPFPALADLLQAYRWNLPAVEWKLVKSFRQGA